MKKFSIISGRIEIDITCKLVGDDLCVIVSGGDKPHIGGVVLSIYRKSLKGDESASCTTSVINLLGHKEEMILRSISEEVSKELNKNVVVLGGIHIDNIDNEEIQFIIGSVHKIAKEIINRYKF